MKNNIFIKICWFLPLFFGVFIFLGWVITKYDYLMVAGIYNIYLGIILTIIGLMIGIIKLIINKVNNKKTENKKILVLTILLLSNIPIAFGILYSAIIINTGYTTKIINQTDYLIDNCLIVGGGIEKNIGRIKPNEEKTKTVWFKKDGTLDFVYQLNENKKVIKIEGYVTRSMGGYRLIEIVD